MPFLKGTGSRRDRQPAFRADRSSIGGMEAFGTVLIAVAVVAIVVSCLSYLGSGGVYKGLGRTGLSLDEPREQPGPPPGSAAAAAEAQDEIRQMLEAKSARMERRGEAPLDIDAEIAALASTAPAADPGLRAEVRELVVAHNARRARRGEEPLDVESEVDRRLRKFGA
jgi:hypothetical protein